MVGDHLEEGVLRLSPLRLAVLAVGLSLGSTALAEQPKLVLGRYESALKLMDQGECDKAREMLFPGGRAVKGEEVAISDMGDCYLRSANKASDQAEAQRRRETGAGWILRAANLGVREAQVTAVKLYLNGQVFFTDPYEAVKWYLLWQNNSSQLQLGQVEFDKNMAKQLNAFGPDIWAEARARATAWTPTVSQAIDPDAP